MLKVNGYQTNYKQLYIYNDKGEILYQTERPYELDINLKADVRSARKLNFNKGDCFEYKTNTESYSKANGKDLYVHNSYIDVIKVKEKKHFEAHGETCYKDIYTLKLQDDTKIEVESNFYTRYEYTQDRINGEQIAEIMSSCIFKGNISYYEVERMLEKLDIKIKE